MEYNNIAISFNTGITQATAIISLTGSIVWNGGFVLGEILNPSTFLPKEAIQLDDGVSLSNFTTVRLIHIGTDVLGLDVELNQPIVLTQSGFIPNAGYLIMSSIDGYNWKYEPAKTVTTDSG